MKAPHAQGTWILEVFQPFAAACCSHSSNCHAWKVLLVNRNISHLTALPIYIGEIWKYNNHWLFGFHFRTAQFLKCFQSKLNRKAGIFTFLRLEVRFRKQTSVFMTISVGGRPKLWKKSGQIFNYANILSYYSQTRTQVFFLFVFF